MKQFGGLVRALTAAEAEFIIIGGVAGALLGAARTTLDLDVVYRRSRENLSRVVDAIGPLHPYLRGAPPGLPFRFDVKTLERGLNFTLTTDIGSLDLLGDVTGAGGYEEMFPRSHEVDAFGVRCRCVDIDTLIAMKRAAGRSKDFEAIAELEIIRDLKRAGSTPPPEPTR